MKKRGCPTTYSHEYIEKVYEYVEQCVDEEYEFHKTRGDKSDTYERRIKVNLPTIEGFAHYIGVPLSTLDGWRGKIDINGELVHKGFSVAIEFLKEKQKEKLIQSGLSGEYNPTIAKLVLSTNHGMREKNESEVTHKVASLGFLEKN